MHTWKVEKSNNTYLWMIYTLTLSDLISTMISFTSRGSFLGVLSLLLHSTVCLDTATVSILSEAEYAIEPNCVQSCVFKTYISSIGSFLLSELGCQRFAARAQDSVRVVVDREIARRYTTHVIAPS